MSDPRRHGPPPPQHQDVQPGREHEMEPPPDYAPRHACGRLQGRVALVTGGDSGIGRAVAVAFAAEGADVAIVYLDEHDDAAETRRLVEERGRKCLALPADIGREKGAATAVKSALDEFGRLDIVVNNAAQQHPQKSLSDVTGEQIEQTFRTNIFSMFFVTKAALPHLGRGAAIRQHGFRHGLQGQSHPSRLLRDEGRRRLVHAGALAIPRG